MSKRFLFFGLSGFGLTYLSKKLQQIKKLINLVVVTLSYVA